MKRDKKEFKMPMTTKKTGNDIKTGSVINLPTTTSPVTPPGRLTADSFMKKPTGQVGFKFSSIMLSFLQLKDDPL